MSSLDLDCVVSLDCNKLSFNVAFDTFNGLIDTIGVGTKSGKVTRMLTATVVSSDTDGNNASVGLPVATSTCFSITLYPGCRSRRYPPNPEFCSLFIINESDDPTPLRCNVCNFNYLN